MAVSKLQVFNPTYGDHRVLAFPFWTSGLINFRESQPFPSTPTTISIAYQEIFSAFIRRLVYES